MTQEQKNEITKIAKEFASPFKESIGEIAGSGWLIVDPLAGYLNFIGFKNTLKQLPANNNHPQVLIITLQDGTRFCPAGSDLKKLYPSAKDWMWL